MFSLLALNACASNSKLSDVSPTSANLSGDWVLNEHLSETVVMGPSARAKGQKQKGSPQGRGKGERKGRGAKKEKTGQLSFSRKPPVMTASEMKIDQGEQGMGVSYPEQPYRDVDWGETEVRRTTVTSGWDANGALVVKSKSERQAYTEIYHLDATAKVLTITFVVNGVNGKNEFVRVFDRRDPS